jgi:hypothetical protein
MVYEKLAEKLRKKTRGVTRRHLSSATGRRGDAEPRNT